MGLGGVSNGLNSASQLLQQVKQEEQKLKALEKQLENAKSALRAARKKKETALVQLDSMQKSKDTLVEKISFANERKQVVDKSSKDVQSLIGKHSETANETKQKKGDLISQKDNLQGKLDGKKKASEVAAEKQKKLKSEKDNLTNVGLGILTGTKAVVDSMQIITEAKIARDEKKKANDVKNISNDNAEKINKLEKDKKQAKDKVNEIGKETDALKADRVKVENSAKQNTNEKSKIAQDEAKISNKINEHSKNEKRLHLNLDKEKFKIQTFKTEQNSNRNKLSRVDGDIKDLTGKIVNLKKEIQINKTTLKKVPISNKTN